MIAPREPSGSSSLASWCRKLLRFVISNELKPGVGYKIRRTTAGTVLEIKPGVGGAAPPAEYIVKEHHDDYLVCRTWDGTTEGETDINIAKPRELRFSITSETIDGYVIAYSAHSEANQTRHAEYDVSNAEDQVIVPRYLTSGDNPTIIRAETVSYTGVTVDDVEVTLEDCNRAGRAWAKKDSTL